jgi:hypothetical protein
MQVHDQLVKKSSWNDTLTGSSWRLDVLAQSQHVDEVGGIAVIFPRFDRRVARPSVANLLDQALNFVVVVAAAHSIDILSSTRIIHT